MEGKRMGVWGPVFRILLVMGICGSAWAGGNPEEIGQKTVLNIPQVPLEEKFDVRESDFSGRADWIYQASDWILNLYITQKGTRSQGSHGVLIFEGNEVSGTRDETRALPIGTVQYNGTAAAKANLWDDTGWQMIDALVKPIVHEPVDNVIPEGSRPDMKKLESDFDAQEN